MALLTEVMKLLNPFSATLASTPASPEGGHGPAPEDRGTQNPFSRAQSSDREAQDFSSRHAISPKLSAELPSGLQPSSFQRTSSGESSGS